MNDPLSATVKRFLQKRLEPGRALLLGYSGGPDSKALLYVLKGCERFLDFSLHLAHIDHAWREESAHEALALQEEAKGLDLPFHLKTLEAADFTPGNLEEQARDHRQQFFREVYEKYNCQALLLGHHAGDQAEVVLKRLFEGAHLTHLKGIEAERALGGITIWRPWLNVHKPQIIKWLDAHKLPYITDSTNANPAFLRGRMRTEIFPEIQRQFGKDSTENLVRLAESASELTDYLQKRIAPLLAKVEQTAEAQQLQLRQELPELHPFEIKFLVREWLALRGSMASREVIDQAAEALFSAVEPLKFPVNQGWLHVQKGELQLHINSN